MVYDQQFYIAGLKADDKAVIDKLYKKYHAKIYHFAKSYLKLTDEAADIVQEVFVKLWDRRGSLKSDTDLDALVFTITRNTVISVFRKKSSEKKYLDHLTSLAVDADNQTTETLDYRSLEGELNSLIAKLPEKRRLVFLMSRQQGLKNAEIAQQLDISEKTVEDHMTKALAFIRKHMESYGIFGVLVVYLVLG
ncbi:MAG: RNA polymerase sigma-70 factor [Breznakibacter sp.]